VLLAAGAAVRVEQYAARRSLWVDEALLSWSIVHRNYAGLTHPLAYKQGAPIGFLFLERTAVVALGNNELVLRLVPLIAGLASLLLTWQLARPLFDRAAALVAVALVAASPSLIYYSNEVKQYSSDVALTLLVVWVARPLFGDPSKRRVVVASIVAAATVWLSYPAVVAVAAVVLVLLVRAVVEERWTDVRLTIAAAIPAAASVTAAWAVSLRRLSGEAFFKTFWAAGFPPRHAGVVDAARWVGRAIDAVMADPVGLRFTVLGALMAGVGLTVVARRSRPFGALPAVIVVMVVGGALARVYPLQGRLALFLVPLVALALAATTDVGGRVGAAFAILVLVLAGHPVRVAANAVWHPVQVAETRPVLEYLAAHRAPGDRIYLHYASGAAFGYYGPKLHLTADGIVDVAAPPCPPLATAFRGATRVWLFVGYHPSAAPPNEDAIFTSRFATVGHPIDVVRAKGAFAVLYDLAEPLDPDGTSALAPPGGRCLRIDPVPPDPAG
jgi:hypothetical protein